MCEPIIKQLENILLFMYKSIVCLTMHFYCNSHTWSIAFVTEIDSINFKCSGSCNKEAVGLPMVQTSVGWHKNKWNEANFHQTLHMQVDSYFKALA